MTRLLDHNSDLHAQLEVLTSEGVATSAIEGERFDPNALRSSLARRLGLPTAGLPAPPRSIEGLVDVLLDATQKLDKPLTQRTLAGWQAALFPTRTLGAKQDPRRRIARGVAHADRLRPDRPAESSTRQSG